MVNIISYICGALLAVYMAHHGMGVWRLVCMQLIYGTISILSLAVITKWRPSMVFSKESLKELFGFGGFIMAANILQTISESSGVDNRQTILGNPNGIFLPSL